MVIAQGTTGDFRIHHRLPVFPLTFITFFGYLELRVVERLVGIQPRNQTSKLFKQYKSIQTD